MGDLFTASEEELTPSEMIERIVELEQFIASADLITNPTEILSVPEWNSELLALKQQLYKRIINQLIAASKLNSLIDDTQIALLFEKYANAVNTFERTGIDTLSVKLQEEINSNGAFKDLLISYVNAKNTITVFQVIARAFINKV